MDLDNLTIADLDLDLTPPPSRGKRKLELSHCIERELDEGDVLTLLADPIRDVHTPAIQTLRQSHHQLAQLIAAGLSNVEVSQITGYSLSRISILQGDPAFAELVRYYSGIKEEIFVDVIQRLKSLSLDTLEVIHERITTKPDSFTNRDLKELLETTADRSGFGPKSTVQVDHVHTLDDLLSSVKEEIRKKSHGNITTLDARSQSPGPSRDFGAGLGLKVIDQTGEHSDPSDSREQSRGAAISEKGGEGTTGAIIPFPRPEGS